MLLEKVRAFLYSFGSTGLIIIGTLLVCGLGSFFVGNYLASQPPFTIPMNLITAETLSNVYTLSGYERGGLNGDAPNIVWNSKTGGVVVAVGTGVKDFFAQDKLLASADDCQREVDAEKISTSGGYYSGVCSVSAEYIYWQNDQWIFFAAPTKGELDKVIRDYVY